MFFQSGDEETIVRLSYELQPSLGPEFMNMAELKCAASSANVSNKHLAELS